MLEMVSFAMVECAQPYKMQSSQMFCICKWNNEIEYIQFKPSAIRGKWNSFQARIKREKIVFREPYE